MNENYYQKLGLDQRKTDLRSWVRYAEVWGDLGCGVQSDLELKLVDVSQMAATTTGRRAAAGLGFGVWELELCFINILTIVIPNPKISYLYRYILYII